jgi:hypothetical protein
LSVPGSNSVNRALIRSTVYRGAILAKEINVKKLLVLIVLVIALTAAVGLKRGWFQVSSSKGDAAQGNDTTSVTVNVDKTKIRDDKDKVVEKVHEAKDKVAAVVDHHTSK